MNRGRHESAGPYSQWLANAPTANPLYGLIAISHLGTQAFSGRVAGLMGYCLFAELVAGRRFKSAGSAGGLAI